MLPFSQEQFFDMFARYNGAVWPVQLVAYLIVPLLLANVFWPRLKLAEWVVFALAALWAFTGIGYHMLFFARINPAAYGFGVLFVLQAGLLIRGRGHLTPLRGAGALARTGGRAMIAYAAVVYPVLNAALGHEWPAAPAFGITPCPLVITTFGVCLLSGRRVPWWLFVMPLLWSVIGGSAAVLLSVPADFALPVSAVVALLLNARK